MMFPNRTISGAFLAAIAAVLCGCSAQMIKDRAQEKFQAGETGAAIKELEEGVARYPDSALLRSSLVAIRGDAVTRAVAQSAQLRQARKFDEAESVLRRVLEVDPKNDRVHTLIQEVRTEVQVTALIDKAEKLASAGKKDTALRTLDQALREAPRHTQASMLRRQIEAEMRAEAGGSGRVRLSEGRPISLDFRGAPLSVVLEAITRGSGVNFILDRDVKLSNAVTIFLRSATVDDAIDLVTSAHQLARRSVDPQTVLIYPNTPEKHREHQDQVVRVFHLANADAKSTAQLLRTMLRVKDPFVDERSNMVAIRESPEIVAMAEKLISLHDAGDAEVMLDVEILEVKTSRLTELGITVPNGVSLTLLGTAAVGGSGGSSGLTLGNIKTINPDRIGITVGNISASLRREVGDFNILANPRIRAKNREKAKVVIGDRFPVVTSTANATGFVSESVSYLDVGLKLDVEPVVSLDDDVTIKLGLEVSAIAGAVRTSGGSLAYQVGTRNANTTLRLRDGETQVLAGLISNDDRTSANRIPGLGDLPIAGRLFSNTKDEFQRTELMLAITPRVLRSAFRPDVSQAEIWIGTENSPRLKSAPRTTPMAPATAPANQPGMIAAAPATPGSSAATSASTALTPEAAPRPVEPVRLVLKSAAPLKSGQLHTIPVHLVSPVAIRGAVVELTFDPKQVEIGEVVEGSFFRQNGGVTNFTQSIDASKGKVAVGVLRNDAAGVSGDAAAFDLKLKLKAAGTAEIVVTGLRPIGLGGPAEAVKQLKLQLTAE